MSVENNILHLLCQTNLKKGPTYVFRFCFVLFIAKCEILIIFSVLCLHLKLVDFTSETLAIKLDFE